MAKVKLKGLPEIEKKIERTFDKVSSSKQMRNEIGEFVVGRIQGEARRGRPLNEQRKFPPLKESTKAIREALASKNPTHPTFSVNRSNLTFSGQLIDNIVFELGRKVITIFVDNTLRFPIVGSDDGQNRKTNREVDRDLRKRGFFLYTAKGIDSNERVGKRINNIVKKFVRRAIKINFGS